MADSRPIGVFDSGLGGLTVVKELKKHLPFENIVYFGDTGRVPYGTKSKETIEKYAIQDEHFLLHKDVKLIVAACGTVSSVAAHTGDNLPVPFVGVVEHSVKAAVKVTKNKKIGIIGTAATISSGAHEKAIKKLLPEAQVFANNCNLFVPIVEEGWYDQNDAVAVETAARYLEPLKAAGVDTLIMGCTHYPVLEPIIAKIMGDTVTLINMGVATAVYVAELLKEKDILNESKNPSYSFFVSDKHKSFRTQAERLLDSEIKETQVEQVDINSL